MGYLENFAQKSWHEKIYALESEIQAEKDYLQNTCQPHKARIRVAYIRGLENQLKKLLEKK